VACSVNGDICISCGQSCVCSQNLCDGISCTVQQSELVTDKDDKCRAMERNQATRKHSPKNTMEDHFNDNPSGTRLLPHKHPTKIFHQNIRSLQYKMNELLCHLSHDPPHILCITEHHLHHEELASFHVENYVLGSCYCRKLKNKGGVSIFVNNSIKFTSLDIQNYYVDQDFEACVIYLNSKHDKLCILAIYRSPRGNFNIFLTDLELTLHKFYNYKFNSVVCGDINVDYLTESSKKNST